MPDAARNYEQSDPTRNAQFWRGWGYEQATGPDVPTDPAHGMTWHAGDLAARQEAIRRSKPVWRRAEREWSRVVRG